MIHGLALGTTNVPRSFLPLGRFGRLFRQLPAWRPGGRTEEERIGRLRALAQEMHRDPPDDGDNEKIPAGYTYFGQFVDHDVTFDATSDLNRQNDPDQLHNFRTPAFDLDSLYGRGPRDQPYLYGATEPGHLALGKARLVPKKQAAGIVEMWDLIRVESEDDLPRNEQGVALVGDPRNDDNVLVSQVQVAFIRFHNAVYDLVRREEPEHPDPFRRAQQLVRWHYQWVIFDDFLPRLVGRPLVAELRRTDPARPSRLRFYRPRAQSFIPVEFSGAAYRLGHSMVRDDYELNGELTKERQGEGRQGRIPIFVADSPQRTPHDDLRGGRPLPRNWSLQWNLFLQLGEGPPQPSRKIDTRLSAGLAQVPIAPGRQESLAYLNLVRGWRLGLPSGQGVAAAMGVERIYTNAELGLEEGIGHEAPLWYYILKEAELEAHQGEQLGPLGARLLAEVFLGLLENDPNSFLNLQPAWRPSLPALSERFELRDIVRFAGLVPG